MTTRKDERAIKRQLTNRKRAEEGMSEFRKKFKRSATFMETEDAIKITPAAVKQKVSIYGRNCFFVLCCYFHNGKHAYRYLDGSSRLVSTFAKAHTFINEYEAIGAKNQAAAKHPTKVFDIVSLR